jgi:MoaA/NifB/PqqE/SkfB family radical SAM enzyme
MNLVLRVLNARSLKLYSHLRLQQFARRRVLGSPRFLKAYGHFVHREIRRLETTPGGCPPPRVVYAESTNACNASCVMCPRDEMTRPIAVMSPETFRALADECAAWGVPEMRLHNFGEPLIDPGLFDKIAYARRKGIRTTIYSNGALLDERRSRALLEAGLDTLYVSLDGADKATFESIRKRLDYDEVCESVKRFCTLRKQGGHELPRVYLTFTSIGQSKETLRRLFERWEGVVDRVFVIDPHTWGGQVDTSRQSVGEGPAFPCVYVWQSLVVLASGEVTSCCIDFNGTFALGRFPEDSLRAIWQGPKLLALRDLHKRHAYGENAVCGPCNANRMWSVYER